MTQHAIKQKDSFETYLSAGYLGSSQVKKAKRSGYHYKYQSDEQTPAQKLGQAIHCAVLEPDQFHQRYTYFGRSQMPYPEKDLKTKANKDYKEEKLKEVGDQGYELLEKVEWIVCDRINLNLKDRYQDIYNLIINSEVETSYYAQDPTTGLYLKARPDSVFESRGIMFDLKSTTNAHPPIFANDCAKYDYPLQAAFHSKVFELVTGVKIVDYFYVAVEKKNPYGVAVFRLPDEDFNRAMVKVDELLGWIKYWEDNQIFKSYESYSDNDFGYIDLSLPMWYNWEA